MRTVRDNSGNTYLLLKRSSDGWLVRDPETGAESYRQAADLEILNGESPLEVTAQAIAEPVRTLLTAVRTERSLGMLIDLERDGPLAVRTMLDRYELCESDLHGHLAEFRAAGLIEEQRVAGERGYATTDCASDAFGTLGVDDRD